MSKEQGKASRYNTGKPELSEIFKFNTGLADLVKVMEMGGFKYPDTVDMSYEQLVGQLVGAVLCDASITPNGLRSTRKANCVDLVTTDFSESEIQSMLQGSAVMRSNGTKSIPTELKKFKERIVREMALQSQQQHEDAHLTSSESHMMVKGFFVTSAEDPQIEKVLTSTSITATQLANFVGSSVVPATRVWDYLEMTLSPYERPLTISNLTMYEVSVNNKGGFTLHGQGNWLKGGKPIKEYLDCASRHISAHINGEIYDPDIGTKHLANGAWNLLAALCLCLSEHPSLDPEFDLEGFIEKYTKEVDGD